MTRQDCPIALQPACAAAALPLPNRQHPAKRWPCAPRLDAMSHSPQSPGAPSRWRQTMQRIAPAAGHGGGGGGAGPAPASPAATGDRSGRRMLGKSLQRVSAALSSARASLALGGTRRLAAASEAAATITRHLPLEYQVLWGMTFARSEARQVRPIFARHVFECACSLITGPPPPYAAASD